MATADPWAPIAVSCYEHPKTRRLAARLGINVGAAVGHLAGIWGHTLLYARDGDLTATDPAEIAAWAYWPGQPADLLAALLDAGYLERTRDGRVLVHEFDLYEGKLVRRQEQANERQANKRQRDAQLALAIDGKPLPLARQRPRADPAPQRTRYVERKAEATMAVKNRGAALIDLFRDQGIDIHLSGQDWSEFGKTTLTNEQILECYLAITNGQFGTPWQRDNLSVRVAIVAWNAYVAAKDRPAHARANGRIAPVLATAMWNPVEGSTW